MSDIVNTKHTLEKYIAYRKNYFDKEPFDEETLISALNTAIEVLNEADKLISSMYYMGVKFYDNDTNSYIIKQKNESIKNHISALQKLREIRNQQR